MFTTDYSNDDDYSSKTIRIRKPRAQKLNRDLLAGSAGKMHNPKDHSRIKDKQELKRALSSFDSDFDFE